MSKAKNVIATYSTNDPGKSAEGDRQAARLGKLLKTIRRDGKYPAPIYDPDLVKLSDAMGKPKRVRVRRAARKGGRR